MKISKNELKRAKPGFVLGKLGKRLLVHPIYGDPRKDRLNQNVIANGKSGIGKSRTFLLPQIFYNAEKMGNSLVITDTKGELYNASADFLRKHGYKVHVINFQRNGFIKSERYNPLRYVKNLVDAQSLVNTILENTSNKSSNSDEMWKNAEASYLTALIMYVIKNFEKQHVNLGSVVRFGVLGAHYKKEMEFLYHLLPAEDPARLMFDAFGIAEDKTRTGILIGFSSRMKHFLNQEIIDLTSQNDFDFKSLVEEKSALFLMLENDDTFSLLPALFFSQLFDFLIQYADSRSDGKLPRHTRFLLDEFANIGKINKFNSHVSIIRSREISVTIIVQMLSQLEDKYPVNEWKEIIGNCDTHVLLGSMSKETVEYYSQIMGSQTIEARHVGMVQSNPTMPVQQAQVEYTKRELMQIDEIFRLNPDKTIIIQSGRYPTLVEKVQYDQIFRNTKKVDWHTELTNRTETYSIPNFDNFFEEISEKLKESKVNEDLDEDEEREEKSEKSNNLVESIDENRLNEAIFGNPESETENEDILDE